MPGNDNRRGCSAASVQSLSEENGCPRPLLPGPLSRAASQFPERRLAEGQQRAEAAVVVRGVRRLGVLLKTVPLMDRQGVRSGRRGLAAETRLDQLGDEASVFEAEFPKGLRLEKVELELG